MSGALNKAISFTKASACGNDFLIVAGTEAGGDLSALTRRLCDRHNGVGADGVEWLFPDSGADVHARLINADGSEAEISGNGTRCVAAEICSRMDKREVVIRTVAGLKKCTLIGSSDTTYEFETNMGRAVVGERLTIEAPGARAVGAQVSIGNPHFVILADKYPDDWQTQAAIIQSQPQFPQGTNVEYVAVRGPNEIEIRLFERGVGETQSSGTGSCASAIAAIADGRVTSPVNVVAPGGAQTVRWENQVYLRGPATLVCRGEFFI
jgi:diaminopimelate epimerase